MGLKWPGCGQPIAAGAATAEAALAAALLAAKTHQAPPSGSGSRTDPLLGVPLTGQTGSGGGRRRRRRGGRGGGAGGATSGGTGGGRRGTPTALGRAPTPTPAPTPAPGPGGTPWPSFSAPWPGSILMWLFQG